MLKKPYKILLPALVFVLAFASCKKDDEQDPGTTPENYDRQAMLQNLSDNYILPAYEAYKSATENLNNKTSDFNAAPSSAALNDLRESWEDALLHWQDVAFLELGPAKTISLRLQTNVYPVDTLVINNNITSGDYNLDLPQNFDAKGFQTIDYLLHGKYDTDDALISWFETTDNAKDYLMDVAAELDANAASVLSDWQGSYSDAFVQNSANNAIGSSVSDIVNALNQHYETYVRKGKVGLPAGVFNGFSQMPMPGHVESLYFGESLPFLHRSLNSIQNFINGRNYETESNGEGLDDYMRHVNATSNGQPLDELIENQFEEIQIALNTVGDPLSEAVVDDGDAVSALYQELQQLVPLLKVSMTDALDVSVTYQDTDGD